eukprot:1253124-Amphidinium_carterae.1
MTKGAFAEYLAQRGGQSRPIVVETTCSGTGAPTYALQVLGLAECTCHRKAVTPLAVCVL